MIAELIMMIILIIVAGVTIRFILGIGSTFLKIIAHFLAGWILLTVVNIIPGVHIPINIITLAISGFGGVAGTVLLALLYFIF